MSSLSANEKAMRDLEIRDSGVDVEDLIRSIKRGVSQADLSIPGRLRDMRIVGIGLELRVIATSGEGGGLKFRVPVIGIESQAGAQTLSRATTTISLSFEPIERKVGAATGPNFEAQITQAVNTVRETVRLAQAGPDPWLLHAGKVENQFGITKTGSLQLFLDRSASSEHVNILTIEII
jgi:hypothetical protein